VNQRNLWMALGGVVLIGAAITLRRALDIEWTAESIRDFVAATGVWGPIVYIALFAFRLAILVPSQFMLLAAGVLFGATLGTVYGAVGLTVSGLVNFALVRVFGASEIRARFPKRFDSAFALAQSHMGAGAVALATGYPVGPITAIQLAAAITGMTLSTFSVAVLAGAFVRAAIYSYFGNALLEGQSLFIGAGFLLAAFVIPLLIPRYRSWLITSFGAARSGPLQADEDAPP